MQGALASPNLGDVSKNEISPDRNFSGGAGQGSPPLPQGEEELKNPKERNTHGLVRRRRIGGVELKRVRALVLPG